MSLAIDTTNIQSVLLSDGKWYDIETDCEFQVDAYEFFEGDFYKEHSSDVTPPLWVDPPCNTGFQFLHKKSGIIAGPMTTIVAVSYCPMEEN